MIHKNILHVDFVDFTIIRNKTLKENPSNTPKVLVHHIFIKACPEIIQQSLLELSTVIYKSKVEMFSSFYSEKLWCIKVFFFATCYVENLNSNFCMFQKQ